MTTEPQITELKPETAAILRRLYGEQLSSVTIESTQEPDGKRTIEEFSAQMADGTLLAPTYAFMSSSTLAVNYDGQGDEIIAGGLATPLHSEDAYNEAMCGDRAYTMIDELIRNDEPAGLSAAIDALPLTGKDTFVLPE